MGNSVLGLSVPLLPRTAEPTADPLAESSRPSTGAKTVFAIKISANCEQGPGLYLTVHMGPVLSNATCGQVGT